MSLHVINGGRPPKPALPQPENRLSATVIEQRVLQEIKRLDAEQLQVVELVIAAITRGAR